MDKTRSFHCPSLGPAKSFSAMRNLRISLSRSAGNLTGRLLASARVRAMEEDMSSTANSPLNNTATSVWDTFTNEEKIGVITGVVLIGFFFGAAVTVATLIWRVSRPKKEPPRQPTCWYNPAYDNVPHEVTITDANEHTDPVERGRVHFAVRQQMSLAQLQPTQRTVHMVHHYLLGEPPTYEESANNIARNYLQNGDYLMEHLRGGRQGAPRGGGRYYRARVGEETSVEPCDEHGDKYFDA